MSIDYMLDEMGYARSAGLWTKGSTADPHSPEEAFNAGWQAAIEAMHAKVGVWLRSIEAAHAKASAGHAVANGNVWKYWAMPGYRIFMWEGYAITPTQIQWQGWWIGPDGDACLSNEGFTPEDVEARGYKPCRNLCQAREAAGFVAKASAGGEGEGGEERARYWAKKGCHIWKWTNDRGGVWVAPSGIETASGLSIREADSMGYTKCTTEAEARRVAGFEDKGEANAL